ncbi:MAG: hypothetical protein HOC74_31160 [Gemmatimonadetes bacterium]|jgi:hypothetical protein|nr:hypothetical protein [Gemmatimonadota bacterium]
MPIKNPLISVPLLTAALSLSPCAALAQDAHQTAPGSIELFFGVLELPFLFAAVTFAFVTARALKGGIFGKGMALMAWGFMVMGIGHLHMQVEHFFHFNLFATLFGSTGGQIAWIIALLVTWSLSGLGFYKMYRASKGG